jgi:hypothetical protein
VITSECLKVTIGGLKILDHVFRATVDQTHQRHAEALCLQWATAISVPNLLFLQVSSLLDDTQSMKKIRSSHSTMSARIECRRL